MNLEFISGLALAIFTLGALIYVIKEFFDINAGDLSRIHRSLLGALKNSAPREAKPVNSHLIGMVGEVTAHSGDSVRPMRVRLNMESWPARLSTSVGELAPVGESVKVTKVEGPILIVEVIEDPTESPTITN